MLLFFECVEPSTWVQYGVIFLETFHELVISCMVLLYFDFTMLASVVQNCYVVAVLSAVAIEAATLI